MFEVSDIAIILICGATCLYCFVLGRRLSALQNTKDGLGAAITTFSKSVADMSATARSTTVQASELAVRLAALIEEAEAACKRAEALSSKLDGQRSESLADLTATRDALSEIMTHAQSLQTRQATPQPPPEDIEVQSREDRLIQNLNHSLGQELRDRKNRMKTLIETDVL